MYNIAECVDLYHFVAADAVAVMKAADSSKVCVGNYDDQFSTLIQKFADLFTNVSSSIS